VSFVASCGLPRTGPTKEEIFAGSVQRQGDAFIVERQRLRDADLGRAGARLRPNFLNAGVVGSDVIQPGDTLSLQIWENVETGS
jgi:polysaccharide biosynthesis/export protein